MAETSPLDLGMQLKCSKCGEWHAVRVAEASEDVTADATERLYWLCRGRRFDAGQRGSAPKLPTRRARRNPDDEGRSRSG
jgi:hypothetical protein